MKQSLVYFSTGPTKFYIMLIKPDNRSTPASGQPRPHIPQPPPSLSGLNDLRELLTRSRAVVGDVWLPFWTHSKKNSPNAPQTLNEASLKTKANAVHKDMLRLYKNW